MIATEPVLRVRFRSMASDVELRVLRPGPGAEVALERAGERIRAAARHLTRFDETSALSRANAAPEAWHLVPAELADALAAARLAHHATAGTFDPRVGAALVAWGYDRSFGGVPLPGPADLSPADLTPADLSPADLTPTAHPVPATPWQPAIGPTAAETALVHLGGSPVDLGGIGKGLAVRWAAAELAGAGDAVLVDAGGDQWLGGGGASGNGWQVGVEDPLGGTDPVLVLGLADLAVATSGVRRRSWRDPQGAPVHHLVDPGTGLPGGSGLVQVSVVHPDPAWAEVWSKTLFLSGRTAVADLADGLALAAAWVDADGRLGCSAALAPHLLWRSR